MPDGSAYNRWIEIRPEVQGGTPVIRGTRITVYSVLGQLDDGDTIDVLVEDNPDIPKEAFEAAAANARENPFVEDPGGKPWRTGWRSG
jgi:uncharacterized protein (DUF433 family)